MYFFVIIRVKKLRGRWKEKKKRPFPRANVTTCFFVFRSSLDHNVSLSPVLPAAAYQLEYDLVPRNFRFSSKSTVISRHISLIYIYIYIYLAYDTVNVCGRVTRTYRVARPFRDKKTTKKKDTFDPTAASIKTAYGFRVHSIRVFLRFARYHTTKCRSQTTAPYFSSRFALHPFKYD